LRDSGIRMIIAGTAMIAMNTLMRKTEPHQKCSISDPPTTGPTAAPSPTEPPQIPIALGRSLGSNTWVMTARVAGMIAEPPMPMMIRPMISSPGFCA
jgi:hypothetical protein